MTSDDQADRPAIGFIGLGHMGRPMARRLAAAGYPVRSYDVDAATSESVAAEIGATAVGDAAGAAARSSIVILMLPSSDVVEDVVLRGGVLDAAAPGTIIIDMSSSEPARTRRLADAAAARDVVLIDAPVSGGVGGAERGSLTIMVGGPAGVVDRVRPILDALGGSVRPAGAVGAGHAVKALNNLMSATHLLSACEAITAGARFGLDPQIVLDIVNGSSGRSASTENKFPNFIVPETFDTGFAMGLMLKDMRIALNLAHSTGTPCRLSEAAVQLWTSAVEAQGAAADHTEIARWVRRPADADREVST